MVELLVKNDLGIFALGSAGEGMNLTFEDRVIVARKMAGVNDGRVPLLIGAGSFSVKEALKFINAVADCKIDGVHIIPYDSKISGDAVEALYSEIADRSPVPIWLYQKHNKDKWHPIETVEKLRNHKNIKGCKVAGFDLRLNQSFLALNREDFQVIGSADSQFFTFMCLGASASTTSVAACFPEMIKYLYQKINENDLSTARETNHKVMNFLKRIPKGAYKHNGESSAEIKIFIITQRYLQRVLCAPLS